MALPQLGVKVLAFLSLVVVQVCVGVVYKLSQQNGSYRYNPSSALTIAEVIKLCMSLTFVLLGAHKSMRELRPSAAAFQAHGSGGGHRAVSSATYARVDQPAAAVDDEAEAETEKRPLNAPSLDDSATDNDINGKPTHVSAAVQGSSKASSAKRQLSDDIDDMEFDMEAGRATDKSHSSSSSSSGLLSAVAQQMREELSVALILHVAGLAGLYCLNNQLTFLLFRLVDAASISLFKSWSTAIAAILLWTLFARPIAALQWASILLQIIGLIVAQYDPRASTATHSEGSYAVLLLSVCITAVCSVWNEQVVKRYHTSLHLQNAVLYSFGTCLNLAAFLYLPASIISGAGPAVPFFEGYTAAALGVVACNSVLGLVITAVYKYADAVVKTFATASATVALLLISSVFFAFPANLHVYMGIAVVFIASYIYFVAATLDTSAKPASSTSAPTAATNSR